MKRRNFLKGLAALMLAPTAALAKTATSPAKVRGIPVAPNVVTPKASKAEMIKAMEKAMREMGESTDKARKAAEEMRKSLEDIYISPEAIDDIRKWGVDQIDETTRSEIYGWAEHGHAVLDNRRILLADFDGGPEQSEAIGCDDWRHFHEVSQQAILVQHGADEEEAGLLT